jgi:hypothetical protein
VNLTNYRKILEGYRDMLDGKVIKGKMDRDKAYHLVDKLNEWYELAKVRFKIK